MKLYEKITYCDNLRETIKFFGLTVIDKQFKEDEITKKILYGLFKTKKTPTRKYHYFLGLKIFSTKRKNSFCLQAQEYKTLLEDIRQIVISETRMANAITFLHSQVFPQFKNCNNGKDVVIVGTGPTLNAYKFNKDLVHVGLNKAFLAKNINKLDYMFAIDYFAVKDFIERLKNYKCTKFIGKQANINLNLISPQHQESTCIPQRIVDEIEAYSFYGDAHRQIFFPDIETCPLMDRGSIAFPALHFSLYTAPKRIFLVGCDTSHNGYFDKSKENTAWQLLGMALDGYVKFKQFAQIYYPDIEIISVNPVGLKGLFRDVYTKSYVSENPELFIGIEDKIEFFEDIIQAGGHNE